MIGLGFLLRNFGMLLGSGVVGEAGTSSDYREKELVNIMKHFIYRTYG